MCQSCWEAPSPEEMSRNETDWCRFLDRPMGSCGFLWLTFTREPLTPRSLEGDGGQGKTIEARPGRSRESPSTVAAACYAVKMPGQTPLTSFPSTIARGREQARGAGCCVSKESSLSRLCAKEGRESVDRLTDGKRAPELSACVCTD